MKNVIFLTKVIAILIVIGVSLSSCAAIFDGGRETVKITTEPPGCELLIEGHYMGTTPMRLEMQKGRTYSMEFRKEGYPNLSYKLEPNVLWGYVAADILTGAIWLAYDFGSYACYGYDDNIHIVFDKPVK